MINYSEIPPPPEGFRQHPVHREIAANPEGQLVRWQVAKKPHCWRPAAGGKSNGYCFVSVGGAGGTMLLVHRLVYEVSVGRSIYPGLMIDHINSDRSDNRTANLREVTPGENVRHALNTSGLPPCVRADGDKYRAQVQVPGYYFGGKRRATPELAAADVPALQQAAEVARRRKREKSQQTSIARHTPGDAPDGFRVSARYPDIAVSGSGGVLKWIGALVRHGWNPARIRWNNGYAFVQPRRGRQAPVHRLVWEAFNGVTDWSPPGGEPLCVDHIDCNPANNRIENLRVVTRALNTRLFYQPKLPRFVYRASGGSYYLKAGVGGVQHYERRFGSVTLAKAAIPAFLARIGHPAATVCAKQAANQLAAAG
jgi:hypothetical protein